jgi:hypothetical protein
LPPADLGSARLATKPSSPAVVILGLLAVLVATVRVSVAATAASPPLLQPDGDGGGRNPPLGELRLLIHPVPDH